MADTLFYAVFFGVAAMFIAVALYSSLSAPKVDGMKVLKSFGIVGGSQGKRRRSAKHLTLEVVALEKGSPDKAVALKIEEVFMDEWQRHFYALSADESRKLASLIETALK